MARTNASATDKPVATGPATTTQSIETTDTLLQPVTPVAATTNDDTAALAQTGPFAAAQASTDPSAVIAESETPEPSEPAIDATAEVTIYPLRSYLDGKEVRRAGGGGYKSPKHDAVSLIAAGLATDKKPKA
jgi:hypothetical protein